MGARLIERLAQDWEDAASEALYWSIIGRDVATAAERDAFDASGRATVAGVLSRGDEWGRPQQRRRALDFGCGAGRLTRALADLFDEAVGVDISQRMLDEARASSTRHANCSFELLSTPDLSSYETASFDLVLSHLVLQHLPDEALIIRCVEEFVRVVRPGGLVAFQLPSSLPLRSRLQPRRRLYVGLRRAGVRRSTLFRLGLQPIRMTAVRPETIAHALAGHGARLLAVNTTRWPQGICSSTYYATR